VTPRRAFQPGRIYLGWQYAPRHADPGPPPRRPVPTDPERVDPGWLAAQRREEKRISRPARVAVCVCLALAAGVIVLGEPLTTWNVAGLALILAGSALATRRSPELAECAAGSDIGGDARAVRGG